MGILARKDAVSSLKEPRQVPVRLKVRETVAS